jgi:Cu+-exporting ATPase
MQRRLLVAAVSTVPVILLAMGGHIASLGLDRLIPPNVTAWLEFAFATPVVGWAGRPFFERAWRSIVHRSLNMFSLIALGMGSAYLYSTVATAVPGIFPAGFRAPDGSVAVYFEAAAVITVLVLLGQVLELRAREQTGGAIRALLNLTPKTAHRITVSGRDEEVPLDWVVIGDRLRVRPGEGVPVDGLLVEGSGAVDESMMSGESEPVAKSIGNRVTGGTLNGSGSFVMEAKAVGSETMLARIVAMVSDAQRSQAPVARLADQVAAYFVPAVVAVALIAFVAWAVYGPAPQLAYALVTAVSVVIVACPCALGLATPMSIAVAVGKGAGAGVLVRSAAALERLDRVNVLVIDKTGTLTEGRPTVTGVVSAITMRETEILRVAASLERLSEHPLAGAIVRASHERGTLLSEVHDFVSLPGKGVTGTVDGRAVGLGNDALMDDLGAANPTLLTTADVLRSDGATVLFLAVDGVMAAVLALADPIKAGAAAVLDRLRADGLRIVMLTGDSRTTAQAVARKLNITEIEADVSPERKRHVIERLKAAGEIVAMAGDGVNDAPALAAADVGIAMGTGTDVAIQSAGITLLKGDLGGIVRARKLSRKTMRNIRENLVFAFAYNVIGISIAAGALYPFFGILLSPMVAALAMSCSSVSVIANALRLRALKL